MFGTTPEDARRPVTQTVRDRARQGRRRHPRKRVRPSENGETEKYVAERLGDTVEMIHQTYGHVTPWMRAGAVRRLGALIAGRPPE